MHARQLTPLRIERLEPRDVPSAVGTELPGRFIVTFRPDVDVETIAAEVRVVSHCRCRR